MKQIIVVILVVLMTIMPCTPAFAAVPTCVLGGPTAVDIHRQLGPGETFILTDRPLVVHLEFQPTRQFPERVGACMLLSGSKVAQKNGILQWVASCGNNEVNRNIRVVEIPFEAIQGKQGTRGPRGEQGPQGPKGDPGRNDSSSSTNNNYYPEVVQPSPAKHNHHGLIIGVVVAVVAVGGGAAFGLRGKSSSSGSINTG